jgi:acetyltransferase-like isoleucine patch superfamily enzyme
MISYLIQVIFAALPDTRFFEIKSFLLRLRGFKVGKNVRVVSSVKLKVKYLSIGDNTYISFDTLIEGGDVLIQIGRNVDIAPRCVIVSGTHKIGGSNHRAGEGMSHPITIGDGTWIGAASTLLGGICIGKGCVIAAGSLVRENIDENCLVAGVPAKVIRKFDDSTGLGSIEEKGTS